MRPSCRANEIHRVVIIGSRTAMPRVAGVSSGRVQTAIASWKQSFPEQSLAGHVLICRPPDQYAGASAAVAFVSKLPTGFTFKISLHSMMRPLARSRSHDKLTP